MNEHFNNTIIHYSLIDKIFSFNQFVDLYFRSNTKWKLRVRPKTVANERYESDGPAFHPTLGNNRLRGIHKIDAKARRHGAGGAGGSLSRAAGQCGHHQDEGEGGQRNVLRHLI